MKNVNIKAILKFKKFHACLIGIIIFFVLIKIFGVKFFLYEITLDLTKYEIKTEDFSKILCCLFWTNIKYFVIMFLISRLKHGKMLINIFLTGLTVTVMFVFVNVYFSCNTIGKLMTLLILYMPSYINFYFFITILEKMETLLENYKKTTKAIEEFKSAIIVISIMILTSFLLALCQTSLSVIVM